MVVTTVLLMMPQLYTDMLVEWGGDSGRPLTTS